MENKKKYLIVLILLIFIGLMIFTFANPNEEYSEKKGSGKTTTTTSAIKTDEDESSSNATTTPSRRETLSTANDNANSGSSNGSNRAEEQTTTVPTTKAPTSENVVTVDLLSNAEELVKKAEKSYANGDYNSAKDAVDNLSDSDDKNALQDRLSAIEEGFNLEELVDNLVQSVKDSKSKTNMDDARTYESKNEITTKVENFNKNADFKQKLEEKLNEVTPLLSDTTAPTIYVNGSEVEEAIAVNTQKDGELIEKKLTATDENETYKKMYIKVDDEDEIELTEDGYTLPSTDGTYTITVRDSAYNEAEVTITIDNTAPKANYVGILNVTNFKADKDINYAKAGEKIRVLVYFSEKLATEPKATINGVEKTLGYAEASSDEENSKYVYLADFDVTAENLEGAVEFKVYGYADELGNTIDIEEALTEATHKTYSGVIVDNTKPKIVSPTKTHTNEQFVINVEDENLATITVNGKTVENGTEITEDGLYTIIATDKAGNEKKFYVRLDTKDPVIDGVDNNTYYNTDVTPVITDDAIKEENITLKKDGEEIEFKSGDTLSVEGHYTLNAKDQSGNETTIEFTIDKTSPVLNFKNGLIVESTEEEPYIITATDDNIDYMVVEDITHNSEKTTVKVENGEVEFTLPTDVEADNRKYSVIAYDKAGNASYRNNFDKEHATNEIYLDNKAPVIDAKGTMVKNGEVLDGNGGSGATYGKLVNVQVSDGSLKKLVVTKNGEQYGDISTWPDNYVPNNILSSALQFTEEGTYVIEATDRYGHVSALTFTLKTSVPDLTAVDMYVTGKNAQPDEEGENKIFYAKEGETIVLNVGLTEKLAKLPTFEISDKSGNTLTIDNVQEYQTNTGYRYQGTYVVESSEVSKLLDGEISIKLSNFVDEYGNEGVTWFKPKNPNAKPQNEVTKTSNGRRVIIDREAIQYAKLRILSDNSYYQTAPVVRYATNGNTITVYAAFEEELAVAPKLKINGSIEVDFGTTPAIVDGKYQYGAQYKLTEADDLSDGEVNIKVYGYADKAGNVGDELTNKNFNVGGQSKVVIDRTAPDLIIDGVRYPSTGSGKITVMQTKINKDGKKYVEIYPDDKGLSGEYYGVWQDGKEKPYGISREMQGTGTIRIFVIDNLGNKKYYTITVTDSEESFESKLESVSDNSFITLPEKDLSGDLDIKANSVTINGNTTAKITGNITIEGKDVTLNNVKIDGQLNIKNSGTQLNNVTATNNVSGVLTIGAENDGKTYENIVINGGTYDISGETNKGIEGEGALRIFNAKDITIKGIKTTGGIHLLNYTGSLKNISGNTINLSEFDPSEISGIIISYPSTLSDNPYTVEDIQNLYSNNTLNVQSHAYYILVEKYPFDHQMKMVNNDGAVNSESSWKAEGIVEVDKPGTAKANSALNTFSISEYQQPTIEAPEITEEETEVTEEENSVDIATTKKAVVPEVFPYLNQAFKVTKTDTLIKESTITVTSEKDEDYQAFIEKGYAPVNVIWWAQFSCDMEKCEGFKEHPSNKMVGTVVEGRRGDVDITMEAPKAKEGYTFVGWEVSTVEYAGLKIQGFEAKYEKDTTEEVEPEKTETTEVKEVLAEAGKNSFITDIIINSLIK